MRDTNNHSPVINNLTNKIKPLDFWSTVRSKYHLNPALLVDFLELNNFHRLQSNNSNTIVKIQNNVVKTYTKNDVYIFVLEYIKFKKNTDLRSQFIKEGETHLIKNNGVLVGLKKLQKKHYKDQKHQSILFFKNLFLVIDNTNIKTYNYSKLNDFIKDQFIYEEQIINCDFDINADYKNSQFNQFVKLVTDNEQHYKNLITAIGYLLHSYKNPSLAKAIIISDILSQATNTPNGRSGKGLIIKAINLILNTHELNGKNIDLSKDKFIFQGIDPKTNLLVLQDVEQNFNFESLFAVLTDKINIERKHLDKITLEFEDSPKIAITTNYTINSNGGSFEDRQHLVLLNNHFTNKCKPEKHFKNLFFIEWNTKEYQLFYGFITYCLQQYLKHGLINYESSQLKKEILIKQTSKIFVSVMNNKYNRLNEYYSLKEITLNVEQDLNKRDSTSVKSRIVSKWLDKWATYKGYKIDTRKSGGVAKISFIKL